MFKKYFLRFRRFRRQHAEGGAVRGWAAEAPLHREVRAEKKQRTFRFIKGICVLMVLWAAVLLFHPFFRLSDIQFVGLEGERGALVQKEVRDYLVHKRWKVIPRNNFFLFSSGAVRTLLARYFPPSYITFRKTFPSGLTIAVEKGGDIFFYDTGEKVYLADYRGVVFEEVSGFATGEKRTFVQGGVTSTLYFPNRGALLAKVGSSLPILYDPLKQFEISESIDTKVRDALLAAYKALDRIVGEGSVHHFALDPRNPEFMRAVFEESQGVWFIHFSSTLPQEKLWNDFEYLWNELKQKGSIASVHYIDMRFPSRAYVR